jgi:hypothetical protein
MEYAAGGELFERICNAGRFSEDEVDRIYYKRISHFTHDMFYYWHLFIPLHRQGSSSNNWFQELAIVTQWYINFSRATIKWNICELWYDTLFFFIAAANMSQRFETRKYSAGW